MKTVVFIFVLVSAVQARVPVKVAVMDLKAGAGIEAVQMPSLTNMLCAEITERHGHGVISSDDIKAMLSHAAGQQSLGCDDTECLIKIGNALGVNYLVAGDVGMVGHIYVLNLKLIDIDNMSVSRRLSEEFPGPEANIVDNLKRAAVTLFTPAGPSPAVTEVPAPAPVKKSVPEPVKRGDTPFSFTPIQVSLLSPLQTFGTRMSVYGLRVNLLYGINQTVIGIDAGAVNRTRKRMIGVQVGVININPKAYGAMFGLINIAGSMVGPQVGLVNVIKRGRGARFAPILNLGLGGG